MIKKESLHRRQFITRTFGSACSAILLGSCSTNSEGSELDEFIRVKMEKDHVPGVAACLLKQGEIVWSGTYGWANIDQQVPMSLDTLQNIGSVSKTFTTTALMQLWEKGKFQLDDDINDYLPFSVRHPSHAEVPITFWQLMTHVSSIRDGSVYGREYACGDPKKALGQWLKDYLTLDGTDFSPEENFHEWAPGGEWSYCNVAYGLLAYLVETLSGTDFGEYCKSSIFKPLEMLETSWYLGGIDVSKHAVPYAWVSGGEVRGPSWGGVPLNLIREEGRVKPESRKEGYEANCLYNHPNFPDGFLRTSVRQLCQYLGTYLNQGICRDYRLLETGTLKEILREQMRKDNRIQGLTWYADANDTGELVWGHGGSDPGINTDVRMRLADRVAAIVFTNTNGITPKEFTDRMLLQPLNNS